MKIRRLILLTQRIAPIANLVILIGSGIWAVFQWYSFKDEYQSYILRQQKVETEAAEQKPLEINSDMSIAERQKFSDGTHLYNITFPVDVRNLSKSQLTVSYTITEVYIGNAAAADLKPGGVAIVNGPPDPWHVQENGPITWTRQAYEASIADGDSDEKMSKWMHSQFDVIGNDGLTAVLSTGEKTWYEPEYLVRAMPNQYVAVVVSFGINDSIDVKSPNVATLYEVQRFKDAEQETAQKDEVE